MIFCKLSKKQRRLTVLQVFDGRCTSIDLPVEVTGSFQTKIQIEDKTYNFPNDHEWHELDSLDDQLQYAINACLINQAEAIQGNKIFRYFLSENHTERDLKEIEENTCNGIWRRVLESLSR